MKSVIFCRVSSKEQEETGYSLPAQEKFLREYAERKDLEVKKVFSVSESASGITRRKVFIQMIEYIKKNKIFTLIVETTDRLTRNFTDVPIIDNWINENDDNQVHLVKEGFVLDKNSRSHEVFTWRMKVATAEFYIKQLSENVKKGQKEKLSQGWIPTKPPLGYKTVGETGHKIHVVDKGTAPLVRKMFEVYASGNYSIKALGKKMHEEGMRSPKGNRLAVSRTHSLLRDPFYMGKIRWNDEIHEGKHQPLISKELFDKVQAMLKSKTTPKYRRHSYLFQGMIRCAGCNGLITWEQQRGHHYGHCNHYHDCDQKAWAKEPEIEEQLLLAFDSLKLKNKRIVAWLKKALKESHQDEIEYHNSTVGELQTRYEAVQKRMDKLYDDKLDEKITQEFYNRKFKQYSDEKDELTETIKGHSSASTGYLNLGINLYELSQRAREIYLKAKAKDMLKEQKNLMRLVFAKITLDEGRLNWEYAKAFKILSQAVEETNCSKVDKIDDFEKETFEHQEKNDVTGQKGTLSPSRPIWLLGLDLNQEPSAYT